MFRNDTHKELKISHFVGLSGVGGVQKNFTEYLNYSDSRSDQLIHKVYTFGNTDPEYCLKVKVFDIRKISNQYLFIKDLISSKIIVNYSEI